LKLISGKWSIYGGIQYDYLNNPGCSMEMKLPAQRTTGNGTWCFFMQGLMSAFDQRTF